MSWSHVASVNGSSSSASFSPGSWPSGVADGDIVVFCAMIAPDGGGQGISCATTGWRQQAAYGEPARMMWARYNAVLALPTITLTGSTTCTWYMLAFRRTEASAIGLILGVDGSPAPAQSYTAYGSDQLLVIFGTVPGDTGSTWSHAGGFTQLVNVNGNGSGNSNAPNIFIGWQNVASPSTIASIYARISTQNRFYMLSAGVCANALF